MHQYMIEGRQFKTTCVVQRNSVPEPQMVLFQKGSLVVNSGSGVTISSHTNGTHLFATMTVASAARSDAGELKCVAVTSSENNSQSSIIHFSVGEFTKLSYDVQWLDYVGTQ